MFLKDHIKYSAIPTLILFPIVGINALYFFLASVLIDIDHYAVYIIRTKKFSIMGMFRYFEELFEYAKNNHCFSLCVFHTLEFLIIMIIFSFYLPIVFYMLMGVTFHMVLDIIFMYRNGHLSKRAYSIIEYLYKRNMVPG